ncbi:hypothetical protein [Pseudomonas sp. CGJS7]|uniref:hypothetical protein n=1 Tax=Pseudomonas sp. CGJS7 TaxID=3109348 RepID=UPI003009FA7A
MSKSALLTPVLLASITVVSALAPVSSAVAGCSDCGWLFVRCMSHADTPEKEQECEDARALCEETFCTNPSAARLALLPPRAETPLPAPDRDDANRAAKTRQSAQ